MKQLVVSLPMYIAVTLIDFPTLLFVRQHFDPFNFSQHSASFVTFELSVN